MEFTVILFKSPKLNSFFYESYSYSTVKKYCIRFFVSVIFIFHFILRICPLFLLRSSVGLVSWCSSNFSNKSFSKCFPMSCYLNWALNKKCNLDHECTYGEDFFISPVRFVPYVWTIANNVRLPSLEEGRRQAKVLIKNVTIFVLFPSKQFLPILLKIQLLQYLNH
jgi:hypothetical protein